MHRFWFPSDTNTQLFQDAMDTTGVKHEMDGRAVVVPEGDKEVRDLAESLGGWDVPDPRSSIGANPFLDIGSQAVRSNPPMAARGGEPLESRKRPPFSEEPTFVPTQPDRLLGMRPAKVPRRSTRGQPL